MPHYIKLRLLSTLFITLLMAALLSGVLAGICDGFSAAWYVAWGRGFATAWPLAHIAALFFGPLSAKLAARMLPVPSA